MIDNANDFLKNILTDQYKDKIQLKQDALHLYTLLLSQDQGQVPPILVFKIPSSANTLSIGVTNLNRAKEEVNVGRKITAIKIIREQGWLNGNMNLKPSLKEAEDFIESFPDPI